MTVLSIQLILLSNLKKAVSLKRANKLSVFWCAKSPLNFPTVRGICGGGHSWWGAFVPGGICSRGHLARGAIVTRGICHGGQMARGAFFQGAFVTRGICSKGHLAQGAIGARGIFSGSKRVGGKCTGANGRGQTAPSRMLISNSIIKLSIFLGKCHK